MTKEELHKKIKQFVYQVIMIFKNYRGEIINEELINEIVQSATRMSAHCRKACETKIEEKVQSGLYQCKDFLDEILYLLNLLEHTKTIDEIQTEMIIIEAVELKQIIEKLCDTSTLLMKE